MRLKNNIFDIIINVICLIQLVGIVVYLIITWSSLPDQIPGHFGADGTVTRWDGKGTLLVMPIFAWVSFCGITIIERFPQIWNTGVRVTEENKIRVYRVIKSLLGALKIILVTAFVLLTVIQSLALNLPDLYLPVIGTLLFGAIIVSMIRLVRAR